MGKHNGKARPSGMAVGAALTNRFKSGRPAKSVGVADPMLHTTDVHAKPTMQSVLEGNDLVAFMEMAELSNRDFAGERQNSVVLTSKAVLGKDMERSREERAAAEARHREALRLPRRPRWDRDTTPEELERKEKDSFLAWRRRLAMAEEEEGLLLTPFEKNLEVWRQLWRVLERSDVVVQVVDARDPMRYWSQDLVSYASELGNKGSVLLLNKADLLPGFARRAWADYFDARNIRYVFWSAYEASVDLEIERGVEREREMGGKGDAEVAIAARRAALDDSGGDARVRVLTRAELMGALEGMAAEAVARAPADDPRRQPHPLTGEPHRPTVGMVGFPNVGKSSTINALFGGKKVAVAPTPGKTKHFQTLLVTDDLALCDCPGLVFPTFASSKPDMVAAGVVPIDRLVDVRACVEVVAARVGREQWRWVYNARVAPPAPHEDPRRPPTAAEVMRAVCIAHGWVNGSGLPDETRSGRMILKDYVDGRLLYFEWPPGSVRPAEADRVVPPAVKARWARDGDVRARGVAMAEEGEGATESVTESVAASVGEGLQGAGAGAARVAGGAGPAAHAVSVPGAVHMTGGMHRAPKAPAVTAGKIQNAGKGAGVDAELRAEMEAMGIEAATSGAPRRPDYKFKNKQARSKGTRGKGAYGIGADGDAEGLGVTYGRRGGLVPVGQ